MDKIIVSLFRDRDEREIDEYHNESNTSGSDSESDSSRSSSSGGETINEQYSSRVLGIPLEVFQEEMRTRAASGSFANPSTSAPSSIPSPSEKEDISYCCAVGVSSKTDEKKLLLGVRIRF